MIDLLERQKGHIGILCSRYSVVRLGVFGSAASGDITPSSDLDFIVEFDESLSAIEYADAYFGLKAALEALLCSEVDLITRRSITNPYFERQLLASEQPLYAA